jgi:hypothetical protein
MVSQSNMQRVIRQVVEFKNSISDTIGDSSGPLSDLEILRLVFLRILKEIDGDLERPPAHQSYRKLGLFDNTHGGRQADSASILRGYSELFLDFDLEQRDDESILDTRILILGGLLEALKSQARRKNRGVYYTPYGLARTISNLSLDAFESQETNSKVSRLLDLRILDNACGSGTFLFAMLEELLARISTRARTIVLDAISVETTKLDVLAPYLLRHSLFGHDLDEDAITIAEAQLWLALYGLKGTALSPIPRTNLRVTDTLVSEASDENYDIVIGNPPYMRLKSGDAKYRHTIKTRYSTTREYNTHALFIQASLSQLKQGGILGYLIHKNLLTLDTFSSLRQSIVETHNLIHLSDCGPGVFRGVTAETAVIVLQKGLGKMPSKVTLSSYDSKSGDCGVTSVVDQDDYCSLISSWNHRYLISILPETMSFLEHMSTLPQLHDYVTIKRGIETGCNRQFISDEPRSRGNWKPLLRGRDIAKYAARSSVHLNHNLAKLAKPGRKDLQDIPKVVVQQNSEHPIAYYDSGHYLVLNSTTYITNANEEFLKASCVLLNSNLISWFFRTVMTNNAGLTVNLLPNNLGMIPIPSEIDLPLFSALCDVLTRLKSASESNPEALVSFQLWHETLVESLIVAAYFPHLVKDNDEYDRFHELMVSLASQTLQSEAKGEEAVISAKNFLKGLEFLQS